MHLICGVGWYHWVVDDLRMEMDAQPAPYLSSTKEEPLPQVLAYSPALTMRNVSKHEADTMLISLLMVRPRG